MNVTKKNGMLTITIPLDEKGRVSASTKTILHATGQVKEAVGDKVATVAVNVYSANPDYVAPKKK